MTTKKVARPASRMRLHPNLQNAKKIKDPTLNAPNRFCNFTVPQAITADGKVIKPKIALDNGNIAPIPLNNFNFSRTNALVINSWFPGFGELALLSQNGIIQNIIQTIADETFKNGIQIISIDENESGKELANKKIKRLEQLMTELSFQDTAKALVRKTMTYGGAFLYPKLKGDDNERDKELLINSSKIKVGDLKYFKILEPVDCYPVNYNASDPFAYNYYNPQEWNALGQTTHNTRMMHFTYNNVDRLLLPTYQFQGISMIQLVLPYLTNFESIRNAINGIINRYNLNVIKTNMTALVNYDESSDPFQDTQTFEDRMSYFNQLRDNYGILALDMATEEFQQFTMSLTGLDKLYSQALEIVCAICRIPATKLLGIAPQGFNATGEHEMNNFYDFIRNVQMAFNPIIKKSMDIMQLSEFGEIDPALSFKWNELEAINDLERAQVQHHKAQAFTAYKQEGIVTATEIRQTLAKDPDSEFLGMEIENPELDELLDMQLAESEDDQEDKS